MKEIKPYIIGIQKIEEHFFSKEKWYVDFQVKIGNQLIADQYKKFNHFRRLREKALNPLFSNPNGLIGYEFFFTACSPLYHNSPDKEMHDAEEMRVAYVQKDFNEDDAIRYMTNKIDAIGIVDWEELGLVLRKLVTMDDWDED